MIKKFIYSIVLKKFFQIHLSSIEKSVANQSVYGKYIPAIQRGIVSGILIIPAILFLDTKIIVQVLIPVTMVAGTAWYAVSLASMKKKFENFGLELTNNLFSAFIISLILLFFVASFSLTHLLWIGYLNKISINLTYIHITASLLGIYVVGNLLYQIFLGSIKYDINDAMLTGQNEAAEKFYKRGLSVLYSTAVTLRNSKSPQVANYLIGVSFYEIFHYVKSLSNDLLDNNYIELSNKLIFNPSISVKEADKIAHKLINEFISICNINENDKDNKHYQAIKDEEYCLKNNDEDQEMIDMRLSIIFEEIASLMEEYGESLFIKKTK